MAQSQTEFDQLIGRLDRILSEMLIESKLIILNSKAQVIFEDPNYQTLKHHAEDMIGAGKKCLKLLGAEMAEVVENQ